jgi:hypothetical protein
MDWIELWGMDWIELWGMDWIELSQDGIGGGHL